MMDYSQNPMDSSHQINNHGDAINEASDIIHMCANCCSSFQSSCTNNASEYSADASRYQSITNNFLYNFPIHETQERYTNEDTSNYSANVNKMLFEIYNLDFIPRLKEKYYPTAGEEEFMEIEQQVDFPLCGPCMNLLKSLFSLYSQFNQIRKIESLLAQQINLLNSLVDCDQSKNQLSSIDNVAKGHSKRTSASSSSSSSSAFQFPPNDRGPWVKVGPRLEDLTVEKIGYAPPSLRHLYQPLAPPSNLVYPQYYSIHPSSFSSHGDGDDNNDHGLDYEYSPSSKNSHCDDEDVKPFAYSMDVEPDLGLEPESPAKSRKSKRNSSTPKNLRRTTKRKRKGSTVKPDKPRVGGKTPKKKKQSVPEIENCDDSNLHDFSSNPSDLQGEPSVLTNEQAKRKEPLSYGVRRRNYIRRQTKVPCPCLYCEEDFQNPEDRAAHVREQHFEGKNFVCSKCGATFKGQVSFDHHTNKAVRKCSAFLLPAALKQIVSNPQRWRYYKPKKERLHCTLSTKEGQPCTFRFKQETALQNHIRKAHAEEKDKVMCSECKKVFKTKRCLQSHFSKMHTEKGRKGYEAGKQKMYEKWKARKREENAKGFVCSHCGIDFMTKQRHTIHLRTAHDDFGAKSKVVICEQCGKKFSTNFFLRKHIRVVHATEERLFICDTCGLSYKTQGNLNTHKSNAHSEEGRKKREAYTRENWRRIKMIKEQEARKNAVNAEMNSDNGSVKAPETTTTVTAWSSASTSMLFGSDPHHHYYNATNDYQPQKKHLM